MTKLLQTALGSYPYTLHVIPTNRNTRNYNTYKVKINRHLDDSTQLNLYRQLKQLVSHPDKLILSTLATSEAHNETSN